jgi:hypothetical protein
MEFKQNKHPNKQIIMNSNFGQEGFKPCLHHHSQILGMVNYELCSACSMQNFAKVLHLHER